MGGSDGEGMTAAASAGPPNDANPRSFEAQFEEQQRRPIRWKALVKRSIGIAFTGVVLYLVAPSILSVLHSWPKLATLNFLWFIPAVVAEGAHFACTFALQRIALRTKAWFAVITAQLSGNAISLIVPGGAVAGDLSHAAWVGAIGFVLFTVFGAVVMSFDAPLLWAGRVAQSVRNRVLKKRAPVDGLPERLLAQRNVIRAVLGQQWWQAMLLSVGRLVFDYLCLLFCVRAVGAHPRPSLILLAYAVAGVIGLLPITPGGIGVVEASLAGFLALAGLDGAQAVLATLAYRLASYWLPMAAGPIAYVAFRHRYRSHGRPTPELGAAST